MTDLVSLLLITIIPIDCKLKLQIFSYTCLFTFLVTFTVYEYSG